MKTILTIFFIFSSMLLFAQPGTLDQTFGNGGMVITPFGNCVKAHAIAMGADGKIVVAGSYRTDSTTYRKNLILLRYNSEGGLDNTFGSDGIVTADLGDIEEGNAVLVQHDGKIVVVGSTDNWTNYYNVILVRYTEDGLLDSTFDSDGIAEVSLANEDDRAMGAALQADGKIVVVGSISFNVNHLDYFISRFNGNGSLDSLFGSNGFVQVDYDNENQEGESITIQADGKILAGGYSNQSMVANFMIARFTSQGIPDSTFGINGKSLTDLGGDDRAYSMTVQPDGKILQNGYTFANYTTDVSLMRYNSDGTPDYSFGTSGIVITDVSGFEDYSRSIALQTDGKILLSGSSRFNTSTDFTLLRYNTDGTTDSTFDEDGIVITNFGGASANAFASVLQQNQKIILAGASDLSIALAQYQLDVATGMVDFSVIQGSELIYPNPVTTQAVLEYKVMQDEAITINMYDLNGRLVQVFFEKQNKLKGTHQEVLKISKSLAPGNYVVQVSNGSESTQIQIVKE
ncbi:MAG TPA: T9SS type A sorting domain-containing protein [Chitinophagales bacterium]|nr:T9SS type A sorting domain-containing protein [Chitinophagales bacterium]